MKSTTMDALDLIRRVAVDLTRSLATDDRYDRLLDAIRSAVPCDAACLLTVDGDVFRPIAAYGLTPEGRSRVYVRREHPRLDVIAGAKEPVRFAPDSNLPDPFDGLLEADATALAHVHACAGAPLTIDGELVGLLTADALDPHAFDTIDDRLFAAVATMAAAAMQTSRLIEALEESAERLGLVAADLMRSNHDRDGDAMIGTSAAMQELNGEVVLVAPADFTVLVTGETGSGKELVARAIHAKSPRAAAPMLYVNCAALPESIAESELFGHVRGAFTGAERDRAGKFEVADGGTLFLDEIGELPLAVQPKLLRALQEGEIQRVGEDVLRRVDVRVVAATNRDLPAEVRAGRFRSDLFHRLNVYPIAVPPLRARPDDILLLAGHFLDRIRLKLGLGAVRLDASARERLIAHDWPGNVRELQNEMHRAALRASRGVPRTEPVIVRAGDILAGAGPDPGPGREVETAPPVPLRAQVERFQRRVIEERVRANDGNWAAAARDLGLHRSNLYHLAQRLGLRGS